MIAHTYTYTHTYTHVSNYEAGSREVYEGIEIILVMCAFHCPVHKVPIKFFTVAEKIRVV